MRLHRHPTSGVAHQHILGLVEKIPYAWLGVTAVELLPILNSTNAIARS